MRRSKENASYWKRRIDKLIEAKPESKLVKYRYRTLRALVFEKYPEIVQSASKDHVEDFIKDVIYLDRQMRWATEEEEKELKKILAQERQLEMGYEPDHYQNVRKMTSL